MPLDARSIAATIAIAGFFLFSFVGWFCGLAPFTCCKRALAGAAVAYFAATFAVKAVNAIVISSMAARQLDTMRDQEDTDSDSKG